MTNIRRAIVAVSCVLAVALLFTGCRKSGGGNAIRVASVGPMTGGQAKQGIDMMHGCTMCVDEWNAKGGVLGRKIELLTADDAEDPKQANAIANKMFTEGVAVVVGEYNSSCTIPASEIYHMHDMLMLTPASTNPRVTERGYRTVFRVCGRDDQQGKTAAEYTVKHLPDAKVVVLHDKTTYGQGLADEFLKNYEALSGRKVLAYQAVVKEDQDFSAVITSVKALNPDLLFWGGLYPQGGLIMRQMRQLGLKAAFMSGDGTYDPEFIKIAGPENAEGAYLTFTLDQEKLPTAQALVQRYRQRFGDVGPYSLYAYEAMNIALQGIVKSKSFEGPKIAEAIHSMTFDTVLGPLQFDAKGDVLKSPYVMWQVQKGTLVQLPVD